MKRVLDDDLAYEILSVVEEVPEGKVATYGQIARLIGRHQNSRLIGLSYDGRNTTEIIPATALSTTAAGWCPVGTNKNICLREKASASKTNNTSI